MSDTPTKPFLSDDAYAKLKFLAQIVLPVLGTLYAGLAAFWGFPKVTEVVGSVAAIDTALGALLSYSSRQYNNSNAVVDAGTLTQVGVDDNGMPQLHMSITKLPEELMAAGSVKLRVDAPSLEMTTTPELDDEPEEH